MVSVELLDKVDGCVREGVRLYGRLTGELSRYRPEEQLRDWLSWFTDNPFGEGPFAVAKANDRVVGFYSYIPLEMRFGARRVKGGKGEFFVVDPEWRNAEEPRTGLSLPLALFRVLREGMRDRGFAATFAVPSRSASLYSLLSGERRLRYSREKYVCSFVDGTDGSSVFAWGGRALKRLVAPLVGAVAQRRWRLDHGYEVRLLQEFPDPSSTAGEEDVNEFLAPTARVLNFRFPGRHYLKYGVFNGGDAVGLFAFTRPARNGLVRSAYWGCGRLPFASVARVVQDVRRRSRLGGAARLDIEVSPPESPGHFDLSTLGMAHERVDQEAFVACLSEEVNRLGESLPWRFTNCHTGFYQRR
jgi:hypothetical protein